MPKPVVYKADSVIYFQGDVDERVYILKSGRVVLRSRDIETGQEINDLIQTGEFFGVKSALGHFPREEDAVVLADAQVVQFSVAEFESLVSSNTRIIIKMLKVFSGQLRRIHSKVSSMLNQDDVIDSAEGMHLSAEFYFRNRQYDHARYIWRRYLELYPNGRHAEEARKQIERAGQSATAHSVRSTTASGGGARPRAELPEIGQLFFEAESSFANGKYDQAVEGFKLVIDRDAKGEYRSKAQVQLGRSYFEKGDYGLTIRHYSALLKEAPRHPQMAEFLYHIGSSYGRSGDTQKGRAFLTKARSGVSDDPALERKIESALAQLGH